MSPGKRVVVLVLLVVSCLIAYTSRPITASATAGINSQISFTGKLVKSDNTNITDGTYNMEFKVYQDGTSAGVGSTLMWTEDYLVAGSTGMPSTGGVTFSGGTFSVNLGSICAFAGGTCGAKTNTGIDFNQNTLWVSVQIGNSTSCTVTSSTTSFNTACGGDGEMSPYIRLTAVPYAANAALLSGIAVTALGQLASNQTWTGTNTFQPTTNISSALIKQTSVASPTADIFNVQTANATTLLQFTGPSANASNIVLQSAGASSTISIGTNAIANTIQIGDATTVNTGNTQLIQIGNLSAAGTANVTIGATTGATGGTTIVQGLTALTLGNVITPTITIQTASAGTINIGDNAIANTIQVGNDTTVNTGNTQNIFIGNLTAAGTANVTLGAFTGATAGNTTLQALGTLALQTATSGAISIGTNALAQTITLGNATGATGLIFNSGTAGATFNQVSSGQVLFTSGSNVPSVDQLTITNTGSSGITTAGLSGLQINYKGGAAAVESSAARVDLTPGSTTGGTWNGLRIVANTTGPVTGVALNGIKLEGPTSQGAGTETGMYIGTGWDTGLDVQSGGLNLAAYTSGGVPSDPAAPPTDNLRIYAKNVGGRMLPKWIGPSGVDTPIQASFGFNRIAMIVSSGLAAAAATTVYNNFGANVTNTASTYTNPALATTNLLTSVRRGRLTTTTTAGALASSYSASAMVWRGNAAGLGGFYFTIRFGLSTLAAGNRAFVGLTDVVSAPTNVDMTTSTTPGKLGVAINANTGNWNWVNNITGTASTPVGLGANFPVDTTSLYELIIFSPPNGSSITYRVSNLSTGTTTGNTVVSTNIPASTTFLSPRFFITNNASAAAAAIDSPGWYMESDN